MPSQSAIQKARELWTTCPVFLDTETTGLGDKAEIVEICVIDHDASILLQSLVRPRRPVPPETTRVHGITDEMVRGAPTWLALWPKLEALLTGRSVGIYNAEFDLRMFQQSHQAIGMPWRPPQMRIFDILNLYSDYSLTLKRISLEDAGRACGIPLPNSHRAYDDALLARELFLFMLQQPG